MWNLDGPPSGPCMDLSGVDPREVGEGDSRNALAFSVISIAGFGHPCFFFNSVRVPTDLRRFVDETE